MPFPESRTFRKKANWLIALGTELGAPMLRAWAAKRAPRPTPPGAWRKALLIGDSHIGDLLYRSASLPLLQAGLPGCELYYLAAPGSSAILEGNPAIKQILPLIRSDSPLDISPAEFAQLRAMRFDVAFCTNCIKYWPELLLALRLGIPNRVGYTYKGFSGWVTHPIPLRFPQPYPVYFQQYAAALTGLEPGGSPRPMIHAAEEDETAAAETWARLDLNREPHVTACFMTTRQATGVWPAENFGRLLRILRDQTGTRVVLCGAAADEPLLGAVNRDFGLGAPILAGQLPLRGLYSFLRRCQLAICTDSGPRHIANAAGLPVFFFRNLRSDPIETGAYLPTETDLCPALGWLEPAAHPAILAQIKPEEVAARICAVINPHQPGFPQATVEHPS